MKKTLIALGTYILIVLLMASCSKGSEVQKSCMFLYVYNDTSYRNLSWVSVHKNGKVQWVPGKQSYLLPGSQKLDKNFILDSGSYIERKGEILFYYSDNCAGPETGICSITRFDFDTKKLPLDTLKKTVIETNPFAEFYVCDMDTFIKNKELLPAMNQYIENKRFVTDLGFRQLQ